MDNPLDAKLHEYYFDNLQLDKPLNDQWIDEETDQIVTDETHPEGDPYDDYYYDFNHVLGAKEIDDTIENSLLDPTQSDLIRPPITQVTPYQHHPQMPEFTTEPPADTDADLTTNDLMTLLHAEIVKKRFGGHHADSLNSFYSTGIKQIVTKIFLVEGRIKNTRTTTDEDRDISEIIYRVEFPDINLTSPTTLKAKSGQPQALTPNLARLKNITYSAHVFLDATITATAVHNNGRMTTRTAVIKKHRTASIPCATRTIPCTTHMANHEMLKSFEEDPLNPGMTFIINGGEWNVGVSENITNNAFHVYKNMYQDEIARGTYISKPGDAFENAYQVIIRYLNNGAITIEVTTTKFDKFKLPFYLIFRVLGMTRDKDIVDNIIYGVPAQVASAMMEIIQKAFNADDQKFNPIKQCTQPEEIASFIAGKITESAEAVLIKKKGSKVDDNVIKYHNNSILNIIDRYIFPHIGTGVEHRIKKLRFFGHLINKLMGVVLGVIMPTDRDSLKQKRLHAAGHSIAKTFKTNFNFTVVQSIKRQLIKSFRDTPFSQIQLAEIVRSAINSDDLERLLMTAITSGEKTITVKRQEVTNRLTSSTLYHKNDLNIKSTLGTLESSNSSASKQNERADFMRRVHGTYAFYICVAHSHETGEKVGKSKQIASMASIIEATSSFALKYVLSQDPNILPLDVCPPQRITQEFLAKVFVYGDWVGCCKHAHEVAAFYRNARRHGHISHLVSIVWDPLVREITFLTDFGRIVCPFVIVYNNLQEYVDAYKASHAAKQAKLAYNKPMPVFKQWIKLTKKHITQLRSKQISMDDLRRERVIEYISADEQDNILVAPSLKHFRESQNDVTMQYTHCGIEQAILGIVALASPGAHHSNATRITYFTNHRKQASAWPYLNYAYRIDKNVTLQHYCERPLISTISDILTYPTGTNVMIAVSCAGWDQEDSVIMNQSSADCTMFNAAFYSYEKAELEKGETFGTLDYTHTMDLRKDAIYTDTVNGIIREGSLVQKNHVLISKSMKLQKPVDQFTHSDTSVIYKQEEPVRVERTIMTTNSDGDALVKVKVRAYRGPDIGTKVSSRSGNKGIASVMYRRADMLYAANGVKADIIGSPMSFPTRMAINQIIEQVWAMIAAWFGIHIDMTIFGGRTAAEAISVLKSLGVKYGGYQTLYDGRTGMYQNALTFFGPTTYMRLQKFVEDEHYAVRTGPKSNITGQPKDGKAADGGLRIGEMESNVLMTHGGGRSYSEKNYNNSDGRIIYICRCGERPIVNKKKDKYQCVRCGDKAEIMAVESSHTANIFINEIQSINVKPTFQLATNKFLQELPV